jgi:hypothetical protein
MYAIMDCSACSLTYKFNLMDLKAWKLCSKQTKEYVNYWNKLLALRGTISLFFSGICLKLHFVYNAVYELNRSLFICSS